jgi:hypothetical protein
MSFGTSSHHPCTDSANQIALISDPTSTVPPFWPWDERDSDYGQGEVIKGEKGVGSGTR